MEGWTIVAILIIAIIGADFYQTQKKGKSKIIRIATITILLLEAILILSRYIK